MGGLLAQIRLGKQLRKTESSEASTPAPSRPKDITGQLNAMFTSKTAPAVSGRNVSGSAEKSEVDLTFTLNSISATIVLLLNKVNLG